MIKNRPKLPQKVRPGTVIKAADHNALIDSLAALIAEVRAVTLCPSSDLGVSRSAEGTTARLKKRPGPPKIPELPFWPTLGRESASPYSYYVTLTEGCVNERVPAPSAAAVIPRKPDTALTSGGVPVHFAITDGQQLSVKVAVDSTGRILTSSSGITVAVEETASANGAHYVPAVDINAGSAGTYHYKICVFHAATSTDPAYLEHFLAGSHISHFQDLPPIGSSGNITGTVSIPYDYATASAKYRLRGLAKDPDGQLSVALSTGAENGRDILFRGNSKNATLKYQIGSASKVTLASFLDGLITTENEILIPIPEPSSPSGLTGHVLIAIYPALVSPDWQGPSYPPPASLHWFKFSNGLLIATTHTTVDYNPSTYVWDDRVVPTGYGDEIRRVIIPTDTGSMWE